MRTYTTRHTVYGFDELAKDVQAKVIEKFAQDEYEHGLNFMTEDMTAYLLDELLPRHKMKTNNAKIYYRLSYSQGDGAMFEGTIQWRGYTVSIRQSGHYYHYNSKEFTIETRHGNDAKESVYDLFNDLYVEICKDLAKYGYEYIDGATSIETVTENIRANEYEFYEDGRLA